MSGEAALAEDDEIGMVAANSALHAHILVMFANKIITVLALARDVDRAQLVIAAFDAGTAARQRKRVGSYPQTSAKHAWVSIVGVSIVGVSGPDLTPPRRIACAAL